MPILGEFNLLALVINSNIEKIIWCQILSSAKYLYGKEIQAPINVDTIRAEPTLVNYPFVLTPTNH